MDNNDINIVYLILLSIIIGLSLKFFFDIINIKLSVKNYIIVLLIIILTVIINVILHHETDYEFKNKILISFIIFAFIYAVLTMLLSMKNYIISLYILLGFIFLLAITDVCLHNIVGGLVRGFLLCPMCFLLTIVQSAELETVLRLQTD